MQQTQPDLDSRTKRGSVCVWRLTKAELVTLALSLHLCAGVKLSSHSADENIESVNVLRCISRLCVTAWLKFLRKKNCWCCELVHHGICTYFKITK